MMALGSPPVRAGDMLAGKYRVERVLGAGGMGVVVAARHVELDQLVAIKFVREDALASEDAVQRFLREARAAVKLKSEHVARVLDVGKLESGAPYMVMEFLEGSDLGKILTDRGPLPVDSAADWILQACEAVAEAHAIGIVHRDLKPENLFLARTVGGGQKIKVLDFGVSKAIGGGASGEMSGLTRTRAMLGSPLYMAPEQMRSSRDVDARADIWALGVVLFQLLTQRWPFEADTMPELCLRVVTEPPMDLGALRPDVPSGICAVIERCLEKDARKRFANAAELATALEPHVQPGSRVLADRARLAMGVGSGVGPTPPIVVAAPSSPTVSSGSSGSGSTPGTSVPWGAERVITPAVAPAPRQRPGSSRLAVGVGVVMLASGAGYLFLARGSGSVPTGPAVSVAAATYLPAAMAPAASASPASPGPPVAEPVAPVLARGAHGVADVPAAVASDRAGARPTPAVPSASTAGTSPPTAPHDGPRNASPGAGLRSTIAGPARPPGKTASTDDDIPTIR
jgi:eukaryotic-like serine/threonine-protein kinase